MKEKIYKWIIMVLIVCLSATAVPVGNVSAADKKEENIVIALDPGHDSKHAGARGNGIKEETTVLKIANYCKKELEKYEGVTVYLTRTNGKCPYPKSTSTRDDIRQRVKAADKKGADIYVSFHLNASPSSKAKGAEIVIQNKNYNSKVASEGKKLSQNILKELKNVGLSMRPEPIYSRTVSDVRYKDKSKADKFAVHYYSKLRGMTGIIVEHAFVSNKSDAKSYLKTETSLKKLGVADAKGIAKYLNLKLPWGKPEIESSKVVDKKAQIQWWPVSEAEGYAVYKKVAGGSWEMIGTTKNTSYKDKSTLKKGKTYYYRIRAYKTTKENAMKNKYDSDFWTERSSSVKVKR